MDSTERITINGYEYQNDDVPADRNFLPDLHGPDGMVSYADVLRLLAENNIDRMLDAVHPRARVFHLSQVEAEQWYVEIGWTTSDYSSIPAVYTNHEVVGYGTSRTSAIADACKRALEGRGDER